MPFTLVKGVFKPDVGIPDGDTIRFAPDNPDLLLSLPRRGRSPRINANNGTISLRYEGIDAIEKDAIEPFASAATNQNLSLLELPTSTREAPGYILTNQIGPNGRPISFVFVGTTEEEDGGPIFLEAIQLSTCAVRICISIFLRYPVCRFTSSSGYSYHFCTKFSTWVLAQ